MARWESRTWTFRRQPQVYRCCEVQVGGNVTALLRVHMQTVPHAATRGVWCACALLQMHCQGKSTPDGVLPQGPTRAPLSRMRACRRGDMQTNQIKSHHRCPDSFNYSCNSACISAAQANINCMCAAHATHILQTHTFEDMHFPTAIKRMHLPVCFNKDNARNKISLKLHTGSKAISSKESC